MATTLTPIGRIPLPGRLALVAALLAVLAMTAYLNALGGDFIYDDRRQILDNPLIRDPNALGEALSKDVWAFKGERREAWSNYWRPTFVFWLVAFERLFGLSNPLPWHLGNLLLHGAATALAFLVLLRLRLPWLVAAGASAVFALHPAHVESVAWISGSPDLLATLPFLGALWLMIPTQGEPGRVPTWGALGLFAVALGAKEIALLFPLAIALVLASHQRAGGRSWDGALRLAVRQSWPFLALAALFFIVRWQVLGRVEIETPWRMGPLGLVLTAPSVVAFYLRQTFWPLELGPSYPLRAVTLDNLGWANLGLPLFAVLVIAALAIWALRGRPRLLAGAALFLVPLAPALNVNAFIQEQLVHDRYLYLPLLGAWVVLLGALEPRLPRRAVVTGLTLVLLGLAVQTWRTNRVWTSELALWQRGVEVDPGSAFNHAQLGHALVASGRPDEALATLNRAIAIRPVTSALLERGPLLAARGRFAEAEADLRLVQRDQPDNPQPYEQLALLFERQGRGADARRELETGRNASPHRRCSLSSNLAVLLYRDGKKAEALAVLEGVRDRVGHERHPLCTRAAFQLGTLFQEQGRLDAARDAYRLFIEASRHDPESQTLRERAEVTLRRLGP